LHGQLEHQLLERHDVLARKRSLPPSLQKARNDVTVSPTPVQGRICITNTCSQNALEGLIGTLVLAGATEELLKEGEGEKNDKSNKGQVGEDDAAGESDQGTGVGNRFGGLVIDNLHDTYYTLSLLFASQLLGKMESLHK
jgi:hypothetical protein